MHRRRAGHRDAPAARRRLSRRTPADAHAGDELAHRVGDEDRDRVAEELRQHHLEGRLDAVALEQRVGAAYAARTIGDLAVLVADLPAARRRSVAAPPAAGPLSRARGFGLLPFVYEHEHPARAGEAYADALDLIGGSLQRAGYELVERIDGQALVFELKERPGWVSLVCVFAFPFGLLALAARRTTRVRVDILPGAGGSSRIRVSGEARRSVRTAFAELTT